LESQQKLLITNSRRIVNRYDLRLPLSHHAQRNPLLRRLHSELRSFQQGLRTEHAVRVSPTQSTSTLATDAYGQISSPVRYALNYKKLPYKTVWIEYHEIEPVAKEVGTKPTKVKPNGWARFIGLSNPTGWNNVVIGIPGTQPRSSATDRQAS